MKKITIFFLLFSFLFTGCGTKQKDLDLDQVKRELNDLVIDEIDYDSLAKNLEDDLSEFTIYSQEEAENILGIQNNEYHKIFFCTSNTSPQTYLVIEPVSDYKEQVEDKITTYWFNRYQNESNEEIKQIYTNRLEQEYGNHFIYIAGTDAVEKLDQIKETKQKVFPDMIFLEKTDLEKMNINVSKVNGFLFAVTNKLDTVEQFLIIDSKDEQEVENAVHNYFENLETEWKDKDEIQYQLLKNRKETKIGNYLIYLVSRENEKAYQIIASCYDDV